MGDVQKYTSINTIFVTHAYKYIFEFGILYMHTPDDRQVRREMSNN